MLYRLQLPEGAYFIATLSAIGIRESDAAALFKAQTPAQHQFLSANAKILSDNLFNLEPQGHC